MKKKHTGVKLPPLPQNLHKFEWTPIHQESFNKLIQALTSVPVLAYPNYEKKFIIEMDTSLKGLGAILLQGEEDGNLHIISYASHMFKMYEHSM